MYYGWMQAADTCVLLAVMLYPFMRGVVIANIEPSQVPVISTGNTISLPEHARSCSSCQSPLSL